MCIVRVLRVSSPLSFVTISAPYTHDTPVAPATLHHDAHSMHLALYISWLCLISPTDGPHPAQCAASTTKDVSGFSINGPRIAPNHPIPYSYETIGWLTAYKTVHVQILPQTPLTFLPVTRLNPLSAIHAKPDPR